MAERVSESAAKFDSTRAGDYDRQARIALAGYEACHELTACVLAAALGSGTKKSLLIVGAGTGQEIVIMGAHQPHWRFVAVDPSAPMIETARTRIAALGFLDRVEFHPGELAKLSADRHDAATLIGVFHHLEDDAARERLLGDIAARLKPGAPFVLAGNCRAYASEPLFMQAWQERWRMHGATEAELREKFATITRGVEPPASEQAVLDHLDRAGLVEPRRFFSSLFWTAWVCRKA